MPYKRVTPIQYSVTGKINRVIQKYLLLQQEEPEARSVLKDVRLHRGECWGTLTVQLLQVGGRLENAPLQAPQSGHVL